MVKIRKKVLIALSGGIDSAVSTYLLLKAGFEVEAGFMKNWSKTEGLLKNDCPWLEDRREALRVAAFFGIPLHTLDFEKQYQKGVMDYFFKEYKVGRTPNPDVMCNKEIKFKLLYDWAMKNGFDYLATGHYAQVKQEIGSRRKDIRFNMHGLKNGTQTGRSFILYPNSFSLCRSVDEFKDQTYFIYNVRTEQLPHLLFPIGGMNKKQVRALAKKIKLPNADRQESMGLCFVGKIRLRDFLEQKLKRKPGVIIDQDGKQIGEHEGLHYYTLGQRQGIKVGSGGPFYVTKKDVEKNVLFVTNNPEDKDLYIREVFIQSVNWINEPKKYPLKLVGRFRHQGELIKLTLEKINHELYKVKFSAPQKAVASGQSLVLYLGNNCLGGGIIA